jgi:hypothetical protein
MCEFPVTSSLLSSLLHTCYNGFFRCVTARLKPRPSQRPNSGHQAVSPSVQFDYNVKTLFIYLERCDRFYMVPSHGGACEDSL